MTSSPLENAVTEPTIEELFYNALGDLAESEAVQELIVLIENRIKRAHNELVSKETIGHSLTDCRPGQWILTNWCMNKLWERVS